ncbi:hypothetical protein ABL78_6816 [Leptomonas seymouri]|uniref:PDZ domain-containing protein n=1 Tax=Leptomonas seymouri TaxID=5684 RepID=A0A0N1III7_LEPSE|nr:hypothetical protein ABL78_6816 [Leptomonas seymouri]|eukprot:KPI84142.1 hypothetical protein ABL78_6816 [Leptomonas seymouri]
MIVPPASAAASWKGTTREKKIGTIVLILLGFAFLCKYLRGAADDAGSDATAAKRADKSLRRDEREGSVTSDAAADMRVAAERYGAEYQDRIKATTAVPTAAAKARPFMGFSLADNIVEGKLVVDGVFVDGPADQTGVDIDHQLLSINNEPATSIEEVRQLVARHCRPGQVTRMKLRKEDGDAEYEVLLWIMTADAEYSGKPYFFDTKTHKVRQSERLKQTWRPGGSPRKADSK